MRISDWSSDVCSSDLPPGKATWKRSRATTRTSSLSDDSRPAASPRGVDLEPLSCEAGEGGAKRRVRARLCIRMQNPKTPAPLPRRMPARIVPARDQIRLDQIHGCARLRRKRSGDHTYEKQPLKRNPL